MPERTRSRSKSRSNSASAAIREAINLIRATQIELQASLGDQ
jgi:hypothetical protein